MSEVICIREDYYNPEIHEIVSGPNLACLDCSLPAVDVILGSVYTDQQNNSFSLLMSNTDFGSVESVSKTTVQNVLHLDNSTEDKEFFQLNFNKPITRSGFIVELNALQEISEEDFNKMRIEVVYGSESFDATIEEGNYKRNYELKKIYAHVLAEEYYNKIDQLSSLNSSGGVLLAMTAVGCKPGEDKSNF